MLKIKGLSKQEKDAIEEVKNRLVKKYGDRLLLLKLYGSKARGEAHKNSDIDILAIVDKDMWEMRDKFFDETFEVMGKYNHKFLISLLVMDEKEYNLNKEAETCLYENIVKDGIDLWKK